MHSWIVNMYLQMDHIEQNVWDVMNRYTPRVPSHRYSINFVPAVDTTNPDTVKKNLLFDPRYGCGKRLFSYLTSHVPKITKPLDV